MTTKTVLFFFVFAVVAASRLRVSSAVEASWKQTCGNKCAGITNDQIHGAPSFESVWKPTCHPWNGQGRAVFQSCFSALSRAATELCTLACEERLNTQQLQNHWKMRRVQGICDKEKGMRPFPTLWDACKDGLQKSISVYGSLGYQLRLSSEECPIEDAEIEVPLEKEEIAKTTTPAPKRVVSDNTPEVVDAEEKPETVNKTIGQVDAVETISSPKLRASAANPAGAAIESQTESVIGNAGIV